MSWTCPNCGRSFKGRNQWHSCVKFTVGDHLSGKPDRTIAMYQTIEDHLLGLQDVRVESVKSFIMFRGPSTFVRLKVRKTSLEIEFQLDHPDDIFPVLQVTKYSTNRYAHVVRVEDLSDVDDQLLNWLSASRETVKS